MALIGKITGNIPALELKKDFENVKNHFLKVLAEDYIQKFSNLIQNKDFKLLKRIPFIVDVNKIELTHCKDIVAPKGYENFSEVINQMANLEGMIVALAHFSDDTVILGHPTQTSSKLSNGDHDLVLFNKESNITRHLEISDVSGVQKDGNGKFLKDLNSLYKTYVSKTNKQKKDGSEFYLVTSTTHWKLYEKKYIDLEGAYKIYYTKDLDNKFKLGNSKTCTDFITAEASIYTLEDVAIIKINFEF